MRMLFLAVLVLSPFTAAAGTETWQIVLGAEHRADEAVRVAVEDLTVYGGKCGVAFEAVSDEAPCAGHLLVVGTAARNRRAAALAAAGIETPQPPENPEGFSIRTVTADGRRVMMVAGGSVPGDVYGLYWVWDRMRVAHAMPDITAARAPAVPVRLGGAWGRGGGAGSSPERMRLALRYSYNWVPGTPILDLVPWDSEPEASVNAKNRAAARELIAYARSLHM